MSSSSSALPAPITTELSGSSARNTGRPVSSRSSASRPFKSAPPPASTMPRSAMSPASSGGVRSSVPFTTSTMALTASASASRTSSPSSHLSVFSKIWCQESRELGWDLQKTDSHAARQADTGITRSRPPDQTDILEVSPREGDRALHSRLRLKHPHQLGAEASGGHINGKGGATFHRHPEPSALANRLPLLLCRHGSEFNLRNGPRHRRQADGRPH